MIAIKYYCKMNVVAWGESIKWGRPLIGDPTHPANQLDIFLHQESEIKYKIRRHFQTLPKEKLFLSCCSIFSQFLMYLLLVICFVFRICGKKIFYSQYLVFPFYIVAWGYWLESFDLLGDTIWVYIFGGGVLRWLRHVLGKWFFFLNFAIWIDFPNIFLSPGDRQKKLCKVIKIIIYLSDSQTFFDSRHKNSLNFGRSTIPWKIFFCQNKTRL